MAIKNHTGEYKVAILMSSAKEIYMVFWDCICGDIDIGGGRSDKGIVREY